MTEGGKTAPSRRTPALTLSMLSADALIDYDSVDRTTRHKPVPRHDPARCKTLPDARHRQLAARYPHPPARGAGEIRLRSKRVPDAGLPAGRIPGVLRLSRCADGKGRRPDQGRT